MNHLRYLTIATVVAGSLVGACKRTETATEPAQRNTGELVRRDLDHAGDRIAQGVENVGDRVAQGAQQAAREAQSGATRMDFRAALNEIAQARCSREARCNNVGDGRRYMNEQACRTVVANDFSRDLNPSECNAGIDRSELTECMNDIRAEDCNNPLDTLSRVAACRTSDLCRTTTVSAL